MAKIPKTKKSNHGGKRPGSGRKLGTKIKTDDQKSVPVSLSIPAGLYHPLREIAEKKERTLTDEIRSAIVSHLIHTD
jgi:hypothetical protein